jgi:ribonuclease P protein component
VISSLHRFHGHNSLNFVYRHGKTVRGQLISVKYGLNERRKRYRCAVVVSKKVSKSAVLRNRIRRRVYEQVRLLGPSITQPYDIVLTVYNEQVATMPAGQLAQLVRVMLRDARIITVHRPGKSIAPGSGHAIIEGKE